MVGSFFRPFSSGDPICLRPIFDSSVSRVPGVSITSVVEFEGAELKNNPDF